MHAILLQQLLVLGAAGGVTEVVVYPDRAQVVRTAQVACGPRAQVTFSEVSPAADAGSFRARTSLGTVEGLRSVERSRDQAFAPKFRELDEQLRQLGREIDAQRDVQSRAANLSRVAQQLSEVSLQFINRELVDQPGSSRTWSAAFDTALTHRLRAAATSQDATAKIRALSQRLSDLQRRRQLLAGTPARKDFTVDVLVSCPSGSKATVQLTYLVGGASWEPAYEARAVEGAVELTTYATVRQSTGEPWENARLILSTAVPRQNATPPEVQPLKVWADERKEEKKVLVRRDELTQHAEAPGGGEAAEGEGRMLAEEQGLSVQLKVPEAVDVPADNSPVRMAVATHRLKASTTLRTAPKLQPFVFRVAELVNTAPFPLLAGPLDAFHRGGFIGRYPLERIPQGGKFSLTFGVDEGLKVERRVVQEVQRDQGFLGSTRRFNYAYLIDIANYRNAPEEVEVSEHIPVSELDDVRVEVEPSTSKGYELKKDDGILTWKVRLGRGEKKTLQLHFHVDVPATYDTGSL
jgi:uncharacterized protein (TIGR02231 family)